jgi:hypothetical protein
MVEEKEMRSRWIALGGFFLAALMSAPVWGATPPQPGTLNYVEGQASLGGQTVTDKSVGTAKLAAGQSLETQNGKAEILLTPGIFLRVADDSTVEMVDPGLANTVVALDHGRALVEVAHIEKANDVRVNLGDSSTKLLKTGLYDFNADTGVIRTFDGEAAVQNDGQTVSLHGGHQLDLNATGKKFKAETFDKKKSQDDFYRWASLRSSYLAEANADAARTYVAGSGWGPGWYGTGWYWDPWFSAYTFIPANGIFYGPFGWGFYSPWVVYGSPFFGVHYGRFGYGHVYRPFGPGYRPPVAVGTRGGFAAPRPGFSRGAFGGRSGGFGVRGGGFHGRR